MLGSSRHNVLLVPFSGGSRKFTKGWPEHLSDIETIYFTFQFILYLFFSAINWTLLLFQVDTYSHSWKMFPQHWTKYIENLDNLVTVTSNLLNIIMQQVGGTRLRVVPHFSSEIVERAKRECAWKSPHARKGDARRVAFSRGRTTRCLRRNKNFPKYSNRNSWLCHTNGDFSAWNMLPKCTPAVHQITDRTG